MNDFFILERRPMKIAGPLPEEICGIINGDTWEWIFRNLDNKN